MSSKLFMMDISDLPTHILESICMGINFRDMKKLSMTNKYMQNFIAESPTLMRRLKLVWKPRQDLEVMLQSNRIYRRIKFDGYDHHTNEDWNISSKFYSGIVKGMPNKVLHNTLCKSVFYTCKSV